MTLSEFVNGMAVVDVGDGGEITDVLTQRPSAWNPAWAKSLAEALAAEWSQVYGNPPVVVYQYVYDPDAYITESLLISLGIHSAIKSALTSQRPEWAEPYISVDDWLSIWPLLASNKGNIYPKDALTQGLLGLMAGHGVITAAQADAVLDSGRRKKKIWEVAGLVRSPSRDDIVELMVRQGLWSVPEVAAGAGDEQ